MEMRGKPGVCAIVLLTIICFLAAAATCLSEESKSDKLLATVGDKKITESDLFEKISMLPPQFRARYQTEEAKQKLLEQTVKFTLLSKEARKLGIHEKKDVARKIEEITNNIIIQELTKQEITDKITVTDAEMKAYYKKNQKEFIKPEKVKASLIMFAVGKDDPPNKKDSQMAKATAALKRLKAGEGFKAVAKEVSEDKRTKKRGGNTGFFSRGKRTKIYGDKFEDAAFSLNKGQLSGVVKGDKGLFIIKLEDKKPEVKQKLEEVKKRIERIIKQKKHKELYDAYLEKLKKKYPVTMYDKAKK